MSSPCDGQQAKNAYLYKYVYFYLILSIFSTNILQRVAVILKPFPIPRYQFTCPEPEHVSQSMCANTERPLGSARTRTAYSCCWITTTQEKAAEHLAFMIWLLNLLVLLINSGTLMRFSMISVILAANRSVNLTLMRTWVQKY